MELHLNLHSENDMIEQTSSNDLSRKEFPDHSKILSPCWSPPFSAGPPIEDVLL